MPYDWLNTNYQNSQMLPQGYKIVDGKKVFDPFNRIDSSKIEDEEDRKYEKQIMRNQLMSFDLQKADYERSIKRENQAQKNLNNASKLIFGK